MSRPIIGCGRAIREEIVRNNVEGTRTVMEAALADGVERIVYTCSVATLKPVAGQSVDETSRHTRKAPSAPTSAARSWPSGWSSR